MGCDIRTAPALLPNPAAHRRATRAFWGAEPDTIVGVAATHADSLCTCGFRRDNQQDVYIWNAATNHPAGMIGLGETPASVPPGLADGEGGNVVTWRGYDSNYPAFGQRNAFLWDPTTQQLWGVLPTDGNMVQAALSPAGDRAVTVSYSAIQTAQALRLRWRARVPRLRRAAAGCLRTPCCGTRRRTASPPQLRHSRATGAP